MELGTILVPLAAAPEDLRCLKGAQALAAKAHAHISALYVVPDALEQLTDLMHREVQIPEAVLAHQASFNAEHRDAVEQEFAAWRTEAGLATDGTSANGHSASLHIAKGNRRAAIGAHALVADLVFAPLPGHTHPQRFDAIAAALFTAGRPVLALPMQAPVPVFAAGQIAAIAWNGSKQASHAITAALPLLRECSEVVVLSVGDSLPHDGLEPILANLRRHGIRASGRLIAEKGDVGALIHREAHAVAARLLVMGAYTNSLAREYSFGGVTDYMLKNATLPLLLAH